MQTHDAIPRWMTIFNECTGTLSLGEPEARAIFDRRLERALGNIYPKGLRSHYRILISNARSQIYMFHDSRNQPAIAVLTPEEGKTPQEQLAEMLRACDPDISGKKGN